jgi:hypothetical protein
MEWVLGRAIRHQNAPASQIFAFYDAFSSEAATTAVARHLTGGRQQWNLGPAGDRLQIRLDQLARHVAERQLGRHPVEVPIGEMLDLTAPGFCAGLVVVNGIGVEAAPILRRRAMGLDGRAFVDFCRRNRWTWQVVLHA